MTDASIALKPAEEQRLAALERRLGVRFKDRRLLLNALVHRSALNERGDLTFGSNERLEFLGDAVLGAVVAERLYALYPQATEGTLTMTRANLVCAPTLARWARQVDLGSCLLLGRGEAQSGVHERDGTLAAAFEAVIAAIYLDPGRAPWARVTRFLDRFLAPELAQASGDRPLLDVKSRLQQLSQTDRGRTPTYRVVETTGPQHGPTFVVAVALGDDELARGTGRSKQAAERAAAEAALAAWPTATVASAASGGDAAAAEG